MKLLPSILALIAGIALLSLATSGEEKSPFGPSNLTTASGKRADPDLYFEASDCGECHIDQFRDWNGSMHSRAHHDPIYLAFAELARKEAGEELYKFCSSCHAPLAVATGEIPGKEHTFLTNEGVTCDACHTVKSIRTFHEGGGANASVVLEEGEERFGPLDKPADNPGHPNGHSEVHGRSEFCSACHTLTHPHNGLVIENTYEEWKKGPYAAAGIHCQDCHMRTAAQASEVARTMKPLKVPGRVAEDLEPRPNVYAHLFVGANANGKLVQQGERHTADAIARLRSAATLALKLPEKAQRVADIEVAVTNVGAGHAIPTSITELRQVWIDLALTDAGGNEVFRSGAVDKDGRVDPDAVMFHSVLVDKDGKVTYKPWAAVKAIKEKLIGPKETVRERYRVPLPEGSRGPYAVKAVLRYRSAPQEVMDELFGKGKYPIRIVDMASATGTLR
jgi:hypothetical protein